ncbi:pleckstrin homology domain-containing family A member 5 isoform X16 [Brachyhypopomus gauderio]|uniref:pleckstrin homology domain-containing family A member 5 isoform X16 n=1 Tax=Brachyhypopomus gauderio TaxID=698409 RepID=UPI00404349D1
MAADLNPDWLSCLPSSWSYGVTRDGRVFFINEEAKSTTWLHPVTGEAVITGHRKTPDLPTGWEEGYTFEGARCFIKVLLFWTLINHKGSSLNTHQSQGFFSSGHSSITRVLLF